MSIDSIVQGLSPAAVYPILSGLVGVESLGVPAPGESALIAASLLTLHTHSHVAASGVAVAGVVGAVVGDSIGYVIGRRYGESALTWLSRRFPKHVTPAHLAYAEHLFANYGARTVFAGRFVALLRMLCGPLAGSLGLSYSRFLLANVLGAVCWVGLIVGAVVTLGAAAQHLLAGVGWVLFVIVGVLALWGFTLGRRRLDARIAEFARTPGD